MLPPESARWEALLAPFADRSASAGYGLIQSPMFEDIGVFQPARRGHRRRPKEMYDFDDKGGRHIALRPEGTASVVRAFVAAPPGHAVEGLVRHAGFRYERPQAGRYRQHHQVGVEAIGSADPDLDVEVIALGHDYLARARPAPGRARSSTRWARRADRARYVDAPAGLAAPSGSATWPPSDRPKVETQPACGCSTASAPATQDVVAATRPRSRSTTSDEAARPLRAGAARPRRARHRLPARAPARARPRLLHAHHLRVPERGARGGAERPSSAAGATTGSSRTLGGPPTPGIGFGSGIERILLACDAEGVFPAPAVRRRRVRGRRRPAATSPATSPPSCAAPASAPTAPSTAGP